MQLVGSLPTSAGNLPGRVAASCRGESPELPRGESSGLVKHLQRNRGRTRGRLPPTAATLRAADASNVGEEAEFSESEQDPAAQPNGWEASEGSENWKMFNVRVRF